MSVKTVQFALEQSASAKGLPTAHIVLSGKPNLREIVGAQQLLLQSLPKFKDFGLAACPKCHSGLDRIVIDFGRPLDKRLSNIITQPVRALPQDISI
jgi:hypothetical protein